VQTNDIIEQLQVNEAQLTSNMLRDLVGEQRAPKGRGRIAGQLEERYNQEGLRVQTHRVANPQKVDERVPNDFYGDIIDTKQGYMGNEVSVELPKEYPERDRAALHDFQTLNDAVDQNSEMVKRAAMTGCGYRLLYVPMGRNEIRVKQLPASETVVYRDGSLDEVTYAMRYWKVRDTTYSGQNSSITERTKVEWYDQSTFTTYMDDGRGNYAMIAPPAPHSFNGVPIIDFKNNEEGLGEAEKVLDLIDAYDTIISATVSEVEQFRLAYMLVKGIGGTIDDAMLRRFEQTGIIPTDKDGSAQFITKDMAVEGVKIILDELRTNIYQFGKSIDLSKDYGGDLRVIGWQVALLNLENSCKVTERKFKKALREQYRMVTDKWREWRTADIDYLDLDFVFTRNFPKDLMSEAKTLGELLGRVSRETAYRLVSFIDDPQTEVEAFSSDETAQAALMLNEPTRSTDPVNQ